MAQPPWNTVWHFLIQLIISSIGIYLVKWKCMAPQRLTHKCSQMFNSRQFKTGNNASVHQQLNDKLQLYPSKEIILSKKKKKNEVLIPTTAWMNLENTMPGERSQVEKVTYSKIHVYEIARRGKSIETKSKLVVARGQREKEVKATAQ